MKASILSLCTLIVNLFFRPAVGSVRGALIPAEIKKAIGLALGASTIVGGLIAALSGVLPDVPKLLTSPVMASLVTFVLTQTILVLGQLSHSESGHSLVGLRTIAQLGIPVRSAGRLQQASDDDLRQAGIAALVNNLPAIPVQAADVLSAYSQSIVGHGEVRKLLFPGLDDEDGAILKEQAEAERLRLSQYLDSVDH